MEHSRRILHRTRNFTGSAVSLVAVEAWIHLYLHSQVSIIYLVVRMTPIMTKSWGELPQMNSHWLIVNKLNSNYSPNSWCIHKCTNRDSKTTRHQRYRNSSNNSNNSSCTMAFRSQWWGRFPLEVIPLSAAMVAVSAAWRQRRIISLQSNNSKTMLISFRPKTTSITIIVCNLEIQSYQNLHISHSTTKTWEWEAILIKIWKIPMMSAVFWVKFRDWKNFNKKWIILN